MKKSRFVQFFTIIALITASISTSLYAQTQSRLNQAIATLEEYSAKIPQLVSKTIRCARGLDTCTQAEITQARTAIGVIGAALAVVAIGITAGTTAKVKGWWPFRAAGVPATTPITTATPTSREFTPEEQKFVQHRPLPVPSRPAPSAPLITKEEVNTAVAQLTMLEASRDQRQMALNNIEKAIAANVISLRDTVPGLPYSAAFQDLINTYKNAWGLTSTYAR